MKRTSAKIQLAFDNEADQLLIKCSKCEELHPIFGTKPEASEVQFMYHCPKMGWCYSGVERPQLEDVMKDLIWYGLLKEYKKDR